MGIKINLTPEEVKDAQGGFNPIPEGVYAATIVDAKLGKSKAQNPMYIIEYLITDGPEVRKNFKLKGWYVLKANALFGVIGLNKAVGFAYPKGAADLEDGGFEFPDADEYLGQEVNIKVIQSSYLTEGDDGEEVTAYRNEVKAVYKADPDKVDGPVDEDAADVKSDLFLT